MACNSCAKGFSLLRQEKGCPGCGFSFCSKCLNNKVFLPKLNSEAKVCTKCKNSVEQKDNKNQIIAPPDAYYKRLATVEDKSAENMSSEPTTNTEDLSIDDQIQARLKKLKEKNETRVPSEVEIAKRLQGIKGASSTSDAEINERLAKLRGMPAIVNQPALPEKDLRTEQEQADDLIKQYLEQTQIDTKYKDEFDSLISDIEGRMLKLKGTQSGKEAGPSSTSTEMNTPSQVVESEDEEESVRKIVEKLKAEATVEENDISPNTHNELPFCEICNEDATMRCLGCRYLFCKQCFKEHKDDDDGCNRYEPYQPPKGSEY